MFIAPSVLFFAFTGSLQLFSLHEAHGSYQPPALIAALGTVHKDQRFGEVPKRPEAARAPATAERAAPPRPVRATPLKTTVLAAGAAAPVLILVL